MLRKYASLIILLLAGIINISSSALHFLHLSFHKGCINDIAMVAEKIGFQVTSLFIPNFAPQAWDGYSSGNALYNIGHERAENTWNLHHDFFNQFDGIITSDTAPLARIFLQNNYQKPLIVWICNRFDYVDTASLDCDFPDTHYYDLLSQCTQKKNVYLVPYTSFESFYATQKGVAFNHEVIKPSGIHHAKSITSAIPASINKSETFFIPPYLNDTVIPTLNVQTYRGRYNGPDDVKDFKGIIHVPYAWSNLAFFENILNGIPYFVPSYTFMMQLLASEAIWWQDTLFFPQYYYLAEWYTKEHSEIITYFDSWDDLEAKIATINFDMLKAYIQSYAQQHVAFMLEKWQVIIDDITAPMIH